MPSGLATSRTCARCAISSAAAEAGRPEPRIVAGFPIAVTSNVDAALQSASAAFAVYGTLPSYRAILDVEGAADAAGVAIVGNEDEVVSQLRRLRDIGITDLNGNPFAVEGDPDALERTRLYEQLRAASDELQMRVQSATAELATQNELLRRQAIELEQASRLKSQFLANMSHEFRTPLNAILGYTHMLLQGVAGDLPPNVRRQLTRIDSNGRHLLTIINEILDITRIEAGKMPMQISEFNLNDLVPEVITELDPVISRSKLTVTSRLSPEPPLMISDRQKVKQVIVNLLSNALKFTHQGGIEIGVEYDPRTRMSSIAVRDTGIGIAPEHHDKIFEDFRQVDDSPSRQYGGTGLGLAICRRLASALGGRITLQSNLGEGSTFTLTIPAEAPQ